MFPINLIKVDLGHVNHIKNHTDCFIPITLIYDRPTLSFIQSYDAG